MATENPNVAASSECETPVRRDTQPLGNEADGTGNVHVDACLFDASDQRVDTQAAFTVSGVGIISGCPDPDKEGPQTSKKTGSTCVLSNFEAANREYHVRVVAGTAGQQTVSFCADPEGDGCGNAESVSTVRIAWGRKDAFPTEAVYGPTEQPELRLITCGGSFDRRRGSYGGNVVVFGSLV